jgi:hypothetical protein
VSPLRRLCLHFPPAQTPSLVERCDHLRRPRCAFGRSDRMPPFGKPNAPLRVRRSSLDSAMQVYPTGTRVNLISIVRLAVRRKGIARSAALHLDCARFARKTGTYRSTRSILECFTRMTTRVPMTIISPRCQWRFRRPAVSSAKSNRNVSFA